MSLFELADVVQKAHDADVTHAHRSQHERDEAVQCAELIGDHLSLAKTPPVAVQAVADLVAEATTHAYRAGYLAALGHLAEEL